MNLPAAALAHRHAVWAAAIGALVFGASAYLTLPVQLFPETAPPLVNILTPYPGAAAVDVADGLSDPIETEAAALEGVREVSSTSQDGLSLVQVEFAYGTDVDLAAVDVQNALTRIRDRLPPAAGASQVLKFSTSDRPVLTIGLLAPDLVPVRRLADDVLAPRLQRLPGVAVVDVFGGSVPEIEIALDRGRLEAYGVDPGTVVAALRAHNVSAPAGRIRTSTRQYTFRVDAEVRRLAELAEIPIPGGGGARLRLDDVAAVSTGAAEDLSRFRVGGRPAIALQILRQDDANTVDVVETLRRDLRALETRYPGIDFVEAEEAASFTRQVVDNMLGSVWQALLLASVVIFLFLGSLRRALVVVISMPMSFALTFAAMQAVGLQLDLVTLTAIILAVGMVVDGSVVVLENISRHHETGVDPDSAALEGAAQVQFSVIAGNATTLVVLVPLLFLYGFVGKVFGPLAATLMIAFLASLLVALTLVPVLSAVVLRRRARPSPVERLSRPWNAVMDRLRDAYLWLLRHALDTPAAVLLIAAVLFGGGIVLLRHQGMELLPRMDSGASFVTVETPAGSSLAQTEDIVRQVEAVILREPEVVRLASQIGFEPGMHSFGGGGVQGPTQAYLSLTLTPRTARTESIWDIQDRLRERLAAVAGIQSLVVRESGNTAKATTAASIVVRLEGPDPVVLDRLGEDLLPLVAAVPGVVNPYRSWRFDERSVDVSLDIQRARELGLSPAVAAAGLRAALDGIDAGLLRTRDADTPIRVRYAEPHRRHRDDALAVRFSGDAAPPVPLGAVADLHDARVRGLVTRADLQPTLDLLALHQGRPLSETAADVAAAVSRLELPLDYAAVVEGESADMAESRAELLGAFASAVVAVYLLLVAQFRSFLHPATILVSIPLSLAGIAIALWIGDKPVSMPVMVGLVLLVGIVVNNAILLIDFVRQGRAAGLPRRRAIVDAVATRFRPIMMTTLSTTVGMVPLALEWALGAERFSPLAMAVIGGLTASTFLTLIVIPVLYDVLDRASARLTPAASHAAP